MLTVCIINSTGEEVFLVADYHAPMMSVITAYKEKTRVVGDTTFYHKGQRVNPSDTPASLSLILGDTLYAITQEGEEQDYEDRIPVSVVYLGKPTYFSVLGRTEVGELAEAMEEEFGVEGAVLRLGDTVLNWMDQTMDDLEVLTGDAFEMVC